MPRIQMLRSFRFGHWDNVVIKKSRGTTCQEPLFE